jgi:hypothetical protein
MQWFSGGKDKIDLDNDTIPSKDNITKIEFNVVTSKIEMHNFLSVCESQAI